MKMLQKTVRLLLIALAVTVASGGVAEAQGRRKKRGAKPAKKDDAKERVSTIANIYMREGRALKGVSVREAGHKAIKYKERGKSTAEVKGERVREIRFTNAPGQYSSGLSKYRAGQFAKAAESFGQARSASPDDSWVWPFSTYWIGQSKLMAGDYAGATKEFEALVAKDPEHFMTPAAIFGLGEAQSGAGQHSKAEATFKKLDDGYGDYWRARGSLGAGNAALAAKNATGARGHYKNAESRGQRHAEIRQAARVGVGKSYILSKAWDRAIEYFDGIISESGADPEVAANAWVGKGDCLMAQGESKNDQKLLKEALIAYQTCSVRYAGVPEAYPKALYQAAKIYEKLGLSDMAKLQRTELKTRCPSTSWAGKLK